MAYKKPQIVAKSSAKKSYVAGCPSNTGIDSHWGNAGSKGGSVCTNLSCELYRTK